jgi:hypothetical protein
MSSRSRTARDTKPSLEAELQQKAGEAFTTTTLDLEANQLVRMEKRKGSPEAAPLARVKRQKLESGGRSSSSGLSSLDSDEEPLLKIGGPQPQQSGKTVSAVPSRLLPHAMSSASVTDSEMSSPEPQTPPPPSRPKTSQKGQGMARTVGPQKTTLSSPEVALSTGRHAQPPVQVKQEEMDPVRMSHVTAGLSIDAEDQDMQVGSASQATRV